MGERIVERAGAHFETMVELFIGQFRAGVEHLARGPLIVGEKNIERVAGWHGLLSFRQFRTGIIL